ncbi:MAG: hypothetical protein OXR73_38560 [Myxococcales bacterium]|nr:hypothetical protein [Myxococcales bacterium]
MMASAAATVELPVGYRDRSGSVHRDLHLRKITGVEEELLYDAALNAGELVSELLAACTLRLGDLAAVDRGVMAKLHVADRNFALLSLRRLTLGDRLTARYCCPHCDAVHGYTEDLADLPVRRLDHAEAVADATVELEDGYRDDKGTLHRKVVLGAPVGADEEFVASFSDRDPVRARDALVLRCIRSFGALPHAALDAYGVELLRALTLGDRQRLASAVNELTLGPDFRRQLNCGQCGRDFEALLDTSGFFGDG